MASILVTRMVGLFNATNQVVVLGTFIFLISTFIRDIITIQNRLDLLIFLSLCQWERWMDNSAENRSEGDIRKFKPRAVGAKKAKKLPQGIIVYPPNKKTGNIWVAEVPLLTGCRAWGKTRDEALGMLRRLAGDYIRSTKADIAARELEIIAGLDYQPNREPPKKIIQRRQIAVPKYQKPVNHFVTGCTIGCIGFSQDGKYAVLPGNITGADGNPDICIWNILTDKIIPLYGRSHHHSVVSVAISSKGDFALASYDITGLLCWDVKNQVLHDYLGVTSNTYQDPLVEMIFSPDDKYFAYHLTYNISIHDTLSGKYIRGFHGNRSHYNEMMFTHDGANLFVGCQDGMIRYDSEGKKEPLLFADARDVRAVSIFPDNQRLVSLEANGTITVWDAISGREISHWYHSKSPSYASDRLSVEEVELVGWSVDMKDPYYMNRLPYLPSRSVAVSPDGKHILSGGCDQYMRLWSLDGSEVGEYRHTSRVIKVAFAHDGQRALSASWDGSIYLWELPL
jgi:WD40 repeat protein/predicted RNase H-like HicB family nuclease